MIDIEVAFYYNILVNSYVCVDLWLSQFATPGERLAVNVLNSLDRCLNT